MSTNATIEPRPLRPRTDDSGDAGGLSARLALAAFGAFVVVAFAVLVFHYGAELWFVGDDWPMLTTRDLTEPASWFRPMSGHWMLLPSVLYTAFYEIFGLRTYTPYLAVVVALDLALAVLIRATLRRCGVGPWTASIVAAVFIVFGAGYPNVFRTINIGHLLSLVLGYVALLLLDHDGPADRRDWLGLAAGCVAITSSGHGIPILLAIGTAAFLRRGWRVALLYTAPAASLFLLWYVVESLAGNVENTTSLAPGRMVDWARRGVVDTFEALGQLTPVAILLALLTIVGLVLTWYGLDVATLRRRAALPAGLLVAAVATPALAATQPRLLGAAGETPSRYLGWIAALLLPVIGIGLYAFIERWRITAPLVLGLLVVGVPGNLAELREGADLVEGWARPTRRTLEAAGYAPLADEVPDDVQPLPQDRLARGVTMGFLTEARNSGKLSEPGDLPALITQPVNARLQLAFRGIDDVPGDLECGQLLEPQEYVAVEGQQFALGGSVDITLLDEQGRRTQAPVGYNSHEGGRVLTVTVPELRFKVSPPPATIAEWCA